MSAQDNMPVTQLIPWAFAFIVAQIFAVHWVVVMVTGSPSLYLAIAGVLLSYGALVIALTLLVLGAWTMEVFSHRRATR